MSDMRSTVLYLWSIYILDLTMTYSYSLAPSAPPMDVNHTRLTSNSVVLQWSPPSAQHLNGIIRAYNVVVYELETGQSNSLSSSQNELSIGSANLQPFYWYNFSVCAVTVAQGPCTDMYSLQTLEDSKLHKNTYMHRFKLIL